MKRRRIDPPEKTLLALQLKSMEMFVPEYQFHPIRKWRFDWACPARKVAVEYDGGVWRRGGGAHSHPVNIERDIDKHNAAQLLGWLVLRMTDKLVKSGDAYEMVVAALASRVRLVPRG